MWKTCADLNNSTQLPNVFHATQHSAVAGVPTSVGVNTVVISPEFTLISFQRNWFATDSHWPWPDRSTRRANVLDTHQLGEKNPCEKPPLAIPLFIVINYVVEMVTILSCMDLTAKDFVHILAICSLCVFLHRLCSYWTVAPIWPIWNPNHSTVCQHCIILLSWLLCYYTYCGATTPPSQ